MNRRKIFFLASIFLSLLLSPAGQALEKPENSPGLEDEIFESPPQEISYSLVQDLPNARAIRRHAHKKSEAQWAGGRFQFQEAPGVADISASESYVVGGTAHEAIVVQTQPGYETTLIFHRTPPGKKLKVFLGLPDIAFKNEKPAQVTLEAWIGQKKILETQVDKKGWRQEQIDLNLPYLLQRSFALTFRITSADSLAMTVLLYGYID